MKRCRSSSSRGRWRRKKLSSSLPSLAGSSALLPSPSCTYYQSASIAKPLCALVKQYHVLIVQDEFCSVLHTRGFERKIVHANLANQIYYRTAEQLHRDLIALCERSSAGHISYSLPLMTVG